MEEAKGEEKTNDDLKAKDKKVDTADDPKADAYTGKIINMPTWADAARGCCWWV